MIAKGNVSFIRPFSSEKLEVLIDISIGHSPTDAAIGKGGVS
jgi:hypothetical protein